jgi:hypothetical protein
MSKLSDHPVSVSIGLFAAVIAISYTVFIFTTGKQSWPDFIKSSEHKKAAPNSNLDQSRDTVKNYAYTNTVEAESEIKIKDAINSFYKATFDRDYNSLLNQYNKEINYYSVKMSNSRAVKEDAAYWQKFKIKSARNIIHWESLKVKNYADGSYFVSFNMDYFTEGEDFNSNRAYNEDIFLKFNSDMTISSINEKILKRNVTS